jgi:hypothetical protein
MPAPPAREGAGERASAEERESAGGGTAMSGSRHIGEGFGFFDGIWCKAAILEMEQGEEGEATEEAEGVRGGGGLEKRAGEVK